MTAVEVSPELAPFGELAILWDPRVPRPRPWTTAQSHWAAALAPQCPDGPLLELGCGTGHVGLLAASLTGRPLIQVDRDPVAAAYVRRNAAATGLSTDVREGPPAEVLGPDERAALVVLDGTEQLVLGLGVALRHLVPGGHVVALLATLEHVDIVRAVLDGIGGDAPERWTVREVRDYSPEGVLLDIGRSDPA